MRTAVRRLLVFSFLPYWLIGCAAVFGQGSDLPGLPSSSPATGAAAGHSPGTSRIEFGRLPGLPSQPTKPEFPGAVLFNGNPSFLTGVRTNHPDLLYREGDGLTVEFTAERESCLYLVYHQADGTSLLLFPNEARVDNRTAAHKTITIPPADEDFRFRVRSPFGTEVLQVLATVKPAPELDGLVHRTGRAAAVPRDVFERLHARLKADPASWTEHHVAIRTVARAGQVPAPTGARVGLFIGASKSQQTGETTKRFSLACDLMAKTMLERGGLKPAKIAVLKDEDASRANIEAAISRWLPSVTQPGDTVFIFYAGHGGVVPNPWKPDLLDGFLTTYDDVFGSGLSQADVEARCREKFITDTALARWLQALPGRQIVLLVSACHAASMLDADVLAKFGMREAVRVKGISQTNVVVLASCGPDELTASPTTDEPVFMAEYLSKAMTQLPAPVTLRQAYDYYHDAMRRNLQTLRIPGAHKPILTDTSLLPIVLAP